MYSNCIDTHQRLVGYRKPIYHWLRAVCQLCFDSPVGNSGHNLRNRESQPNNNSNRNDNQATARHRRYLRKYTNMLNEILATNFVSHNGCHCAYAGEQLKREVEELRNANNYAIWSNLRDVVKTRLDVTFSPK